MGTATATARRPAPRSKYILFALIAVAFFYVMWIDERFFLDSSDPSWEHYGPLKVWLFPHALAAACALLLGPFQFSDRLRARYTKMHRVLGRIYTAGVFIGAPIGIYIQYLDERTGDSRSFTIATAVFAALWMFTTGMGLSLILRHRTKEHRAWMTRSFACALIFIEVRTIDGLTGWGPEHAETTVWVCVAAAIPIADLILHLQEHAPRLRPVRL
jgi:uncharacterized membrane protein